MGIQELLSWCLHWGCVQGVQPLCPLSCVVVLGQTWLLSTPPLYHHKYSAAFLLRIFWMLGAKACLLQSRFPIYCTLVDIKLKPEVL